MSASNCPFCPYAGSLDTIFQISYLLVYHLDVQSKNIQGSRPTKGSASGQEENTLRSWPFIDHAVRATFAGDHANATARPVARMGALVVARGRMPTRWLTLEVVGWRSAGLVRFPLAMTNSIMKTESSSDQ